MDRVLFIDFCNLIVASFMYDNLKVVKYTFKSSLYMHYPSYNYHTRNNNVMLLLYPTIEVIRTNYRYQFVSFWNGILKYIKCQRLRTDFKIALTDYYL